MKNENKMIRLSFVIGTCILMLFLLVYNCTFDEDPTGGTGDDSPDTDYNITINISPGVIKANLSDTARVEILVTDKATAAPVGNLRVTMAISHGSVSPSADYTNGNGIVRAEITSGYEPGTAVLRVRAGGSIKEKEIFYSGNGLTFDLQPSPSIICGDGISTSNLKATLKVGDKGIGAQPITFRTEWGCLADSLTSSVTVLTNDNGVASTFLRSEAVDMHLGGKSSTVSAVWAPTGDFSGNSVQIAADVLMEPLNFKCFFEDLNGNGIDRVNRDNGEICFAVAQMKCDFDSRGVHGVPITFTAEKGAFLDHGMFSESITIFTDPHGRASAELWSGFCDTGSGSTTVITEVANSLDERFCTAGFISNSSCLIDFVGTSGDPDPLCLSINLTSEEQNCRDDPRRSFASFQAQVTNNLTGNAISGAQVLFKLLTDGGLSKDVEDCRPIPPPQCDTTEIVVTTTTGGYAVVYAYVCTYGLTDITVLAKVTNNAYGATDTETITGIGLETGF